MAVEIGNRLELWGVLSSTLPKPDRIPQFLYCIHKSG